MTQTLRLYEYFLPKHYAIELILEREQRQFHGTVTITGHKPHDTQPLFVHAKDLTIHSATIDGELVATQPYAHDAVRLGTDVARGDHTIICTFSGTINDSLHGVYPCYYEHDGVKKELLTTQFESHHAREVFPCIDEPEAKATFQLTLTTEENVTVLSNTPVAKTEKPGDGETEKRQRTVFETTPRMSTYLLAFVVGELHRTSANSRHGTRVSVYSTPSQPISSHRFALQEAVKHLDFFEDYFGTKFPLPTCDHVALPDFSAIAMENWGLITYREGFLVANDLTPMAQKQYISSVIAHELAHQWFGNLVTMRWWDDLWLNESFATLMQYVALDAAHPEWNAWDDYANAETQLALSRDQFAHVQPVQYFVKSPELIAAVFDKAILYAKGSRLLRMAMEHIGQEDFRKGLHQYFTDFSYGNTDGTDLWRSLGKTSGKHIDAFMNAWLTQAGLPVVSVTTHPKGYELSQRRFALGDAESDPSDVLWPIPLAAEDARLPHSLSDRHSPVMPARSPRLNAGNVSHFITAYDEPSYAIVRQQLVDEKLSTVERGAFLYETYVLTQAGHYPPTTLMELIDLYQNESSSEVWSIIAGIIATLRIMVGEDAGSAQFDAWTRQLATPAFKRLGMTPRRNETINEAKIRATLCRLMIESGDQTVIDHFYTQQPGSIDSDLLLVHYVAAAARNSTAAVTRLVSLHNTTTDAHDRMLLARALATSRDKKLLTRMLRSFQDNTVIKPQDLPWWFGSMMQNPLAREMTWNWLIEQWQWLEETYASDKTLDKFIAGSARVMASRDWLERYDEFFAAHVTNSIHRAILIGHDEIEARSSWLERDSETLQTYITSHRPVVG